MSDETTLLPCPFCGGEASKRLFYKGKYRVHCNVCDAHSGDVCNTEAEAIAAWNTRTERHAYEQRITGDGSDWGEIMCSAFDALMAAACDACTFDELEHFRAYIMKEMGE